MTAKYTSGNEYLEEMLKRKQEALKKAAESGELEAKASLENAQKERQKANKAANADYMKYIDPYGIQAETNAKNGLDDSGISQSNSARAYQSYQKRVSENQSDYLGIAGGISLQKLKNDNDLNSSLADAEAEHYDSLYDEYWKNKNFDYEKGRDAVEDARYEREWAYKLASAARSSSSGSRSSSSSSGKSSSSKTYSHTEQTGIRSVGVSLAETAKRSAMSALSYAQSMIEANRLTGNGSYPASSSAALAVLSKAKSCYVGTSQLNEISRRLACV